MYYDYKSIVRTVYIQVTITYKSIAIYKCFFFLQAIGPMPLFLHVFSHRWHDRSPVKTCFGRLRQPYRSSKSIKGIKRMRIISVLFFFMTGMVLNSWSISFEMHTNNHITPPRKLSSMDKWWIRMYLDLVEVESTWHLPCSIVDPWCRIHGTFSFSHCDTIFSFTK